MTLITECCICHDYKNKETHKWYTPTTDERRDNYFKHNKKISHGYCLPCMILMSLAEGMPKNELEQIVKAEEKKAQGYEAQAQIGRSKL